MKLVFITNSLSHHQIALCDALLALLGSDFAFITLYPNAEAKVALGQEHFERAYEHRIYESEAAKASCDALLASAECIIIGTAHYAIIEKYLRKGTLVLRYGERPFKTGKSIRNLANMFVYHNRFRKYNIHLLCASAYAAADYAFLGNYVGRTYKWGYFTRYQHLTKLDLERAKSNAIPQIAWIGRMIDWKHPEVAIQTAIKLKEHQRPFHLTMIGDGYLREQLEQLVASNHLEGEVTFLGNVHASEIAAHLLKTNFVILTSSYEEGWGAVLNEAMANGCVAIASHATGSAPFLIKDGVNGFLYRYEKSAELLDILEVILSNKEEQLRIGWEAYQTIDATWNGSEAAKRLVALIASLLEGKRPTLSDGPCSPALILANNWFRRASRKGDQSR